MMLGLLLNRSIFVTSKIIFLKVFPRFPPKLPKATHKVFRYCETKKYTKLLIRVLHQPKKLQKFSCCPPSHFAITQNFSKTRISNIFVMPSCMLQKFSWYTCQDFRDSSFAKTKNKTTQGKDQLFQLLSFPVRAQLSKNLSVAMNSHSALDNFILRM